MAEKKLTDKQLFTMKNKFLQDIYPKVQPIEFYREVFPEGSLGTQGDLEQRKPNMIVATCYRKTPEEIAAIDAKEKEEQRIYEEKLGLGERVLRPKRYKRRVVSNRIVFDDLAELPALLSNQDPLMEFVIIPPVAFSGKNRTKANAYHMWGIAIDLDGVEMRQLEDLIHQIDNDIVPRPTFLANSGHGMHLYYCFEDPVPMYPRLLEQLQALKNALTECVWNAYTSTISTEKRQYQSIVQGYRAVGSCSKLGKNYRVTAFRTGIKRTLQYLMDWASETGRVDFDEFQHVTLDEAREQWPEWYQHRIVEGKKRRPFKFKHRGVYEAWLRRMELGAFDGNRYNCIAVLFALAYKTDGIEFDEVLNDAMDLVPRLNRLTKDQKNKFTVDDVLDASSYYDEPSQSLGLKSVYRMTKIYIEPTKRNGRKQADHLEEARAIQNVRMVRAGKDWREGNGRPRGSGTAREKVLQYREEHPDANVTDVARALGISRPTVYKWWNGAPAVNSNAQQVKKQPSVVRKTKKQAPAPKAASPKPFDWREVLADAVGLSVEETETLLQQLQGEGKIRKLTWKDFESEYGKKDED